tara:strand:- start:1274 stop:1426 length:153 start_codon:yes stop_codon:yes gene_type:complete
MYILNWQLVFRIQLFLYRNYRLHISLTSHDTQIEHGIFVAIIEMMEALLT